MRAIAILAGTLALVATAAGCGGGDDGRPADGVLRVARRSSPRPCSRCSTQETGTEVEVRYGDSAESAATIAEEGESSPADVFFAQDPGSLGSVEDQLARAAAEGRLWSWSTSASATRRAAGRQVGPLARADVQHGRADRERGPGDGAPTHRPQVEGPIGFAPTNASFQAFVRRCGSPTARTHAAVADGPQGQRPEALREQHADRRGGRRGRDRLGLVNHYYLYLVKEQQPDAPVDNHFLARATPGRSSASPEPPSCRAWTSRTTR